MAMRMTSVDEYQFLTCLKHGVWGAKTDRFKNWKIGDQLVFSVAKRISALAEVAGKDYISDIKIWDNGDFPHQIDIKFKYVLEEENRIPVLGEIRDALIRSWGNSYGYGILNQTVLPEAEASVIVNAVKNQENSLNFYLDSIEEHLVEAKFKRDNKLSKNKKNALKKIVKYDDISNKIHDNTNVIKGNVVIESQEDFICDTEESIHSEAQLLLIELGIITGCSVGIASNDRNRVFKGKVISENCLERLPDFGLNKAATNLISLIDIIWTKQNNPLCAFEVEATTSVYSGLLRMSDLISLIPSLKIKLYIVAEEKRRQKVMKELRRPTFNKIGISEYCKFISIEDLRDLVERVRDFAGFVKPDVIDSISSNAE